MFGERIDAVVLAGTALVLGGVALVNSRYGQRRIWGRAMLPSEVAPKP